MKPIPACAGLHGSRSREAPPVVTYSWCQANAAAREAALGRADSMRADIRALQGSAMSDAAIACDTPTDPQRITAAPLP